MPRLLAAVLLILALHAQAGGWEPFFKPAAGDMRAELAQARKEGKRGLLVMYQFEACPHCKRMKRDITIDAVSREIRCNVSDEEFAERRKVWTPPEPYARRGVLAKYARSVSSASRGAVTDTE